MLLPFVRIRMKLFDRLKIGTSFVGGMATASWKVWTAAVLSPWVLAVVACGFAGACVNGITNFVASKTRYIQKLTTSLYFQNLANNSGMLAHVIDSAEAEQCKELLLAYFLLYVQRDRDFTQQRLDRCAEQWLADKFGVTVDFDVSAAVQKLIDKELIVQQRRSAMADEPVLKVYDLPSAAWIDWTRHGTIASRMRKSPAAGRLVWPTPTGRRFLRNGKRPLLLTVPSRNYNGCRRREPF